MGEGSGDAKRPAAGRGLPRRGRRLGGLLVSQNLMGDQVNGRAFNAVAWVTTVTLIALTLLLVANGFGLEVGVSWGEPSG